MSQIDFDFETFQERVAKQREADLAEARTGLEALEKQHTELEARRDELEAQIGDLDTKILELRSFLGVEKKKRKEPISRERGILAALRKVVAPEWGSLDICFTKPQSIEVIANEVRKVKPMAKDAAINDSLRMLTQEGVLEVSGFRSGRRWQYPGGTVPEPSQTQLETNGVPPVEDEPPVPENAPTRPHDEIVADVAEHIVSSITKAKDGIGAKTIAWIMGETGADEQHIEAAVKRLQSEGKVEVSQSANGDDSTVIRFPAEPGSKEELKRTKITGNLLFPNMDQPPHA